MVLTIVYMYINYIRVEFLLLNLVFVGIDLKKCGKYM